MVCFGFHSLQDYTMLVSSIKCMINFLQLASWGVFFVLVRISSVFHLHIMLGLNLKNKTIERKNPAV
jgi:hypothetical protein